MTIPLEDRMKIAIAPPGATLTEFKRNMLQRWLTEPARFRDLQGRTMAVLRVPQTLCGMGECRRSGRCCFNDASRHQPWCIDNLARSQSELFHNLLAVLMLCDLDFCNPDEATIDEQAVVEAAP